MGRLLARAAMHTKILSISGLEVGARESIRQFLNRVGPQSTLSIASRYGLSYRAARSWLERCEDSRMIRAHEQQELQFAGGKSRMIIWEVR